MIVRNEKYMLLGALVRWFVGDFLMLFSY